MHCGPVRRHRTQQLRPRPQSGDVAELLKPQERIRLRKRQVSFQSPGSWPDPFKVDNGAPRPVIGHVKGSLHSVLCGDPDGDRSTWCDVATLKGSPYLILARAVERRLITSRSVRSYRFSGGYNAPPKVTAG
jgi:hypothetical protein